MPGDPTTEVGPLEGLDNGSVHELALEAAEVHLDVHPAHHAVLPHRDIDVPPAAVQLVDGIDDFT